MTSPAQRLLVAIAAGFTHPPSVARIKMLAANLDLKLKLYSAVYDKYLSTWQAGGHADLEKLRAILVQGEEDRLAEVKEDLLGVCDDTDLEVAWQHPAADGILDAAKAFNADLVVLSNTHHGPLPRLTMTHTDWEVMRRADVPVLIAKDRETHGYKRILVAVDPVHEYDKPAALDATLVAEARKLAEPFGAEVHLVHGYPTQQSMLSPESVLPLEIIEAWRTTHTNATMQFAEAQGIDEDKVHIVGHNPRLAIQEVAKQIDADVVVMGVVSRSFFKELVIGRTAEHLIDALECDVLTLNAAR